MTKMWFACLVLVPATALAEPVDDDWSSGAPHDGWRLDAKLGITDGKDNHLPDGYGLGVQLGHESMSDRTGITKGVALEVSHFSTDFMGATPDYRETAYFALAFVRAAYHGETWRPYASAGAGVSYVSAFDPRVGSASDTMLALSFSVGIPYTLTVSAVNKIGLAHSGALPSSQCDTMRPASMWSTSKGCGGSASMLLS